MKVNSKLVAVALTAFLSCATIGCVSSKLQRADQNTPPATRLILESDGPGLTSTLETVIVFDGPGSWKRRAFWDEYVISIANPGPRPVRLLAARLYDEHISQVAPSDNWEELERQSANWWDRNATAENLVLDAGMSAAILGCAGSSAAFGLFAIAGALPPAWPLLAGTLLVSGGAMALTDSQETEARKFITDEFARRRLDLPTELDAGATLNGSLFFRATPSPTALVILYRDRGVVKRSTIKLAPLAELHRRPGSRADSAPVGTLANLANHPATP
jgi:hypothetical protein